MKFLFCLLSIIFSSDAVISQTLPWRTLLYFSASTLTALETDTLSNTIYAGSFNHLYRITDNGNTYDTVDVRIASHILSLGNGILFNGDYGSLGILRSTDNGNTWTSVFPFWGIVYIFYDGFRLWAANGDGVLLFSDDTGNNWESNSFNVNSLVMSLCADSPYVYLGTYNAGYYYSDNYGNDWYQYAGIQGPGYLCLDSNKNLYIATNNSLIFSSDHGTTWEQRSSLDPPPQYMTIDRYNNLYYSDKWGQGLFQSSDLGTSWNKISTLSLTSEVKFIDSSIFIKNQHTLLAYMPGYTNEAGTNMFPLSINNKYQFISYQSIFDEGTTYELDLREIVKDTIINERHYFKFSNSNNLYRFQSDSNLAYIRYGDLEGLYADFNLGNYQSYMKFNPYTNSYYEVNVSTDYEMVMGSMRKTFTWSVDGNSYSDESFAENLGIIYHGGGTSSPGGGFSMHSFLVSALIRDSAGNYNFYSDGYKPEISFEPFYTLDLTPIKYFTATITHHHNYRNTYYGELSDGVIFVDSAYVEYFYKKDTLETLKQKKAGSRTPVTDVYHYSLFIDTVLIQNGYSLYYRIVSSDKSLIPHYTYSPDSGYYIAQYNPVSIKQDGRIPDSFSMEQNYPNPFNPTTTIGFGIKNKSNVKIIVLNVIGEEVAVILNEEKDAGYHQAEFNAVNLPSGVYFYRIIAEDFIQTKKMILLK